MNSVNSNELVAIAFITKPRGIRGEVIANVLTDFPERFDKLEQVFAIQQDGKTLELEIERHFFQKKESFLSSKSLIQSKKLKICEMPKFAFPNQKLLSLKKTNSLIGN